MAGKMNASKRFEYAERKFKKEIGRNLKISNSFYYPPLRPIS